MLNETLLLDFQTLWANLQFLLLVLLPWNGAIEARGQFHCIVYGIFDHRPITESWSRHHDSFVEQIWKNGTWVPSIFLKLGSLSHICIQLQKLEEFYEMATSPSLSFPGLACICESFLHIEKTIPGCSNKRNKKARRQPRKNLDCISSAGWRLSPKNQNKA